MLFEACSNEAVRIYKDVAQLIWNVGNVLIMWTHGTFDNLLFLDLHWYFVSSLSWRGVFSAVPLVFAMFILGCDTVSNNCLRHNVW